MGYWYTNIVKRRTHVTREEALACLGVTAEEFDRYCILTDTHPFIPSKDKLTNKSTRIQYEITDIHRIRESEPYKKMKLKEENARKRGVYRRTGREYKIDYLRDERIDYGKMLLEKYPAFEDIYEDLGEALTSLIITARLIEEKKNFCIRFESDIAVKISRELSLFYLYLALTRNIEKVFIGKEGVFYSTEMGGYEIFWRESYPLSDLEDTLGINYNIIVQVAEFNAYLLEKVNFRLFKGLSQEYYVGFIREFRKIHFDVIEYIPQKEKITKEKPEKIEKITVESLKTEDDTRENFAQKEHTGAFGNIDLIKMVQSVPKEIRLLTPQKPVEIFNGQKIWVCNSSKTLVHSLQLLISAGGGEVVDSAAEATICICGEIPQDFRAEYNYAHPQIIYDSYNQKALQSTSFYRPGQEIPTHICPYKSRLETSDLDVFNMSENKKKQIDSIINHRK